MQTWKEKWLQLIINFWLIFFICFLSARLVLKQFNMFDEIITAEISAVISFIMLLPHIINGKKKREYANKEHGSSRWGRKADIKPLIDKDFFKNIILSATEYLSMNMRQTMLNCHVFIIGGSGAGKSRFYAKPNIMQMNASYVVTDPSGEHLHDEGKMLEQNGYKVKVFNVVDMARSMHFNPLNYFVETEDILRFVELLIANTNGGNGSANNSARDPFWTNAEKLWLMAHISFVQETCLEHEKTLNSVVFLLNHSEVKEEDESYKSAVDILFEELEQKNPDSFSVKQYKKYKLAAGKTAKSILISVGVRLSCFDIPKVSALVADDEMVLDRMGDEKTALFLIINDKDPTYNFLVAILLDVLFNTLCRRATKQPDIHLKIPVRCILDEIANIGYFPNLHILVAVLRKHWISLEFLFQNVNQAKALYKDHWATIEGNCDTTVFLGGKGEDTTKYVSKDLLGSATIDTVSYGGSGASGSMGLNSYNSTEQKAGRFLLDETEVSRLDKDSCIVSIRGLPPFKSAKYDPRQHPNYKQLADYDEANAYVFHRGLDLQHASIQYYTVDLQEE
ncbi:VirD4-like conjugal transfer protein, CD1115 family [Faecalispora sporosphaeroides]|uniref:VirD4-like conjugal transfer protein, CD1115 family n=1 Tax=Faecalispora sporosphaeroides TaxID=1549 RepID=UPI00036590E5|nr:type IV secretory system conjugative DNA transfer family protein [Faecalispora sporosphaeroides]